MEQPYGRNSYSKCVQGKGGLKNRPQTNIVEYFLCIGTVKYTKASSPPSKMSLFSSIIITIVLSYAIIRIYIILHIYLQVSETERLEELHWVIGHSVLEKINSIYFRGISAHEYHLRFQESSFKNPNVLLRIQMFLISKLHK